LLGKNKVTKICCFVNDHDNASFGKDHGNASLKITALLWKSTLTLCPIV